MSDIMTAQDGKPILPLATNVGEMKHWLRESDYCDMFVIEIGGQRHRLGVDPDIGRLFDRYVLDEEHFDGPEALADHALFACADDTEVILLGQESDEASDDASLKYVPYKDVRRGALLTSDLEYFAALREEYKRKLNVHD